MSGAVWLNGEFEMKHIGIIGTGGVGGYFGGRLVTGLSGESGIQVHFIARGPHLQAIREHGLLLSTVSDEERICRPATATDRIEELPDLDVCLICVKSYDLQGVLHRLKQVITRDSIIIPLLNGVDIYSRIRSVIQESIVFPGCVYVGTHIERPGRIVQRGGLCQILFGKDPQNPGRSPGGIIDLFDRCCIAYRWLEDPNPEIWKKFLFIASFGMAGACYGQTLGQMIADNQSRKDVKSMMHEIMKVAWNQGIVLRSTIVEEAFQKAGQFPYEARCSFHRDYEQMDKPDERELFGGTIIRLAESSGVAVPVTKRIYDDLNSMKKLSRETAV